MTQFDTQSRYLTAVRVAGVAAAFSAVVVALLAYDFMMQRRAKHPADDIAYSALLGSVREQPANEALRKSFRELDWRLRQEYFRQRAFTLAGAGLLLAGLAVFLVAMKSAIALRRTLPTPGTMSAPRDFDSPRARAARWAVGGLVLVLASMALALVVGLDTNLPKSEGDLLALLEKTDGAEGNRVLPPPPDATTPPKPKEPTDPTLTPPAAPPIAPAPSDEPPPSDDEMAKAWPRFRGPRGTGVSAYDNVPTTWDGEQGTNVKWKTAVPLPGNNSPIVWGNRVFLSGGDDKKREVYCFDADSGKILWTQPVAAANNADAPKVMDKTGFAAPTMASDGRRVYAIFPTGDLAAFTLDGVPVWSKSLGPLKNSYGHAASLLVYKNWLIVPLDQGDKRSSESKLHALRSDNGEVVWSVKRDVPNSWTTPVIMRVGQRDLIITAADPFAIAYDAKDGSEVWRAKVLRQDVGPSPTFFGETVYTANEFPALTAIRATGNGDVTKDKKCVLWTGEDNLPDTCSPLATENGVFTLSSNGVLTCYDAESGEVRWELELDGNCNSSPSLVGKQVLVIGEEGKCWFIEPGDDGGKIVSEASLGEDCVTSPAFQDGRIYLRGRDHLFCIGK